MSILKPSKVTETTGLQSVQTVERLIEDLDQRGLLVFLVLLGQQSMKLLSEEHITKITKPSILKVDNG